MQLEQESVADPLNMQEIRRLAVGRDIRVAVDRKSDQIVGYIACRVKPQSFVRIKRIIVHPKCRQKGVGTLLINQFVMWVERGYCGPIDRYSATVPDWNLGAQRFFRANRFACIGIRPKEYEDDSDGYEFRWYLK